MARRLTLVAGRGGLVASGVAAARSAGWQVTVLAIDPGVTGVDPVIPVDLEQAGGFLAQVHATRPDALCFVGAVRVSDKARAALAEKLLNRAETLDDDSLLALAPSLAARMKAELIGIQHLMPDLLAPSGMLFGAEPLTPEDARRADAALAAARTIGRLGLGQAIVFAGLRPVAAEDATGTDALLQRVATMRDKGLVGQGEGMLTLAKAPRPGQNDLLDLPAIGPRTLELAHAAGVGLVVIAARQTLLIDRVRMASIARATGLRVLALGDD